MADIPNILMPFQRRFLEAFAKTALKKDFFLTGGTALAHFYLQHRLSEDLDFFTEIPNAVSRVRPVLDSIAVSLSANLEVHREYESFLEVFLNTESEKVRCDFALTSPFRLQPIQAADEFGIENVSLVEKLPRLLKPLDLPTLRDFFNEQIARLMKKVEKKS